MEKLKNMLEEKGFEILDNIKPFKSPNTYVVCAEKHILNIRFNVLINAVGLYEAYLHAGENKSGSYSRHIIDLKTEDEIIKWFEPNYFKMLKEELSNM